MKIQSFKNSMFSKFTSAITIVAMVVMFAPYHFADAAAYTGISDIMSREKATTKSTHKIVFTLGTSMVAGGTIAINFNTFTGTMALADVQICHGASTGLENGTAAVTGTPCTATTETLAASNGATTVWGGAWSGSTLTLTAPSGTPTYLPLATHKFTLFVTATNITNPALSSPTVTITGSNGDSGNFATPIIDDDQVFVTATVNSSITFDIDTATTNTDTNPLYTVPLGSLTTAAVNGSNHSTVNSIWFNLDTNSTGGAAISVSSANAALKSTVVPGDTIPSAAGTMTAGTAKYGGCVGNISGLTTVSPFNGTCTATPAGNVVGGLTVAPQNVFTVAAPVAGGRGEMFIDAAISTATVAHPDYADTLTFVATGSY